MMWLTGRCKISVLLLVVATVMLTQQASYYPLRAPYWGSCKSSSIQTSTEW